MDMEKLTFCLCEGRHDFPGDPKGIFGKSIENPMDFDALFKKANQSIPEGTTDIQVYATGLTAAMLAVVDVCEQRRINLTVLHYSTTDGTYHEQYVGNFETCPFCKNRKSVLDYQCPHCGG
jgi:hypothetical protein